jgi:hypothetical protein
MTNKPQEPVSHHVIASDTDSAYFTLTSLLNAVYPDIDTFSKKERIDILLKITDVIQTKANEQLNKTCQDLFNVNDKHYFALKQEVIAERAYWSGKRRYALYIVNKEGVDIEELEMKGLDLMKSNFPPYFKQFGETLIKMILFNESKESIDAFILDFKDSINTVDWKKLLKPTGLKKIDEYIERSPKTGELFSVLKKKCPINTKASIYSNDLLKHYGKTKKYPIFTVGDKMYIAKLKPNPYKLEVLGLNGYNDAPELLAIVNTYIDRSGLFDSIIRNKLEEMFNDLKWDLNLNPHRADFFSFF